MALHLEAIYPNTTDKLTRSIETLDKQLAALPPARMSPTVPTLGYLSNYVKSADTTIAIDIILDQAAHIDMLMIFPVAAIDENNTPHSFQFPEHFKVELMTDEGNSELIADYSSIRYPTPELEPQLFPCPPQLKVSRIRFTALKIPPNPKEYSSDYFMALSEVMAFSGEQNVILNAQVQTDCFTQKPLTWGPDFLVDGFSNYAPVELHWNVPIPALVSSQNEVIIKLDLGRDVTIDEFRIWPIDLSPNHSHTSSHGQHFPTSIKVETAVHADFTDAITIFHGQRLTIPNVGPLMLATTPTMGRYLRVTASDPFTYPGDTRQGIAFSEIEFFANGRLVSSDLIPEIVNAAYAAPQQLTDGLSKTGKIHPLKQWMLQITHRSKLEKRRDELKKQLDIIHDKQQILIHKMLVLIVFVTLSFLFTYWIARYRHQKRLHRMRDEIAAELHDEVGANISSIASTAELLLETLPEATPKQKRLFNNIIQTARLTAGETNLLIQFLERRRIEGNLIHQMQTAAQQLLPDTPHQFIWKNPEAFNQLSSSQKWDLLLLLKESLNNIVKHANASKVEIEGGSDKRKLSLQIHDNGKGIHTKNILPSHLQDRARKLKGQITVDSTTDSGTTISFIMKHRKNYIL
ncbi:sensor histidine kinase [Coraliomargarita sp. W4R72]